MYKIDDDVCLWVEQGDTIHLKAVTPHGDPVELTEHDAEKLILFLQQALKSIGSGTQTSD